MCIVILPIGRVAVCHPFSIIVPNLPMVFPFSFATASLSSLAHQSLCCCRIHWLTTILSCTNPSIHLITLFLQNVLFDTYRLCAESQLHGLYTGDIYYPTVTMWWLHQRSQFQVPLFTCSTQFRKNEVTLMHCVYKIWTVASVLLLEILSI